MRTVFLVCGGDGGGYGRNGAKLWGWECQGCGGGGLNSRVGHAISRHASSSYYRAISVLLFEQHLALARIGTHTHINAYFTHSLMILVAILSLDYHSICVCWIHMRGRDHLIGHA